MYVIGWFESNYRCLFFELSCLYLRKTDQASALPGDIFMIVVLKYLYPLAEVDKAYTLSTIETIDTESVTIKKQQCFLQYETD